MKPVCLCWDPLVSYARIPGVTWRGYVVTIRVVAYSLRLPCLLKPIYVTLVCYFVTWWEIVTLYSVWLTPLQPCDCKKIMSSHLLPPGDWRPCNRLWYGMTSEMLMLDTRDMHAAWCRYVINTLNQQSQWNVSMQSSSCIVCSRCW